MRLTEVPLAEIDAHMSDPRVAEHLPLMPESWNRAATEKLVATKEACWQRDGLGHWAILADGRYAGWGGFQKEGDEWDLGLVLRADCFGMGPAIIAKMLGIARADARIPFVTFLLPPSRSKLAALARLGAQAVGEAKVDAVRFLKFRLETT